MVGSSRVRRMPGFSVSYYFLEWIKDIVCTCAYVRASNELKQIYPHRRPLSKVGRVDAADDNKFHVLFMRGM
jgi:hypothetical protein